jgi:hypothetical protein
LLVSLILDRKIEGRIDQVLNFERWRRVGGKGWAAGVRKGMGGGWE